MLLAGYVGTPNLADRTGFIFNLSTTDWRQGSVIPNLCWTCFKALDWGLWGVGSLTRSRSRIDASWSKPRRLAASLRVAIRPTLLELIEEPLDQNAGSVEIWPEAYRLAAIAA